MADQRRPGIGNVGSYQVSGLPHLTRSLMNQGDVLTVNFPSVTRNIQVFVTPSGSISLDVKCKAIHFLAAGGQTGFQMASSLTGIEPAMMFNLTGSGINTP